MNRQGLPSPLPHLITDPSLAHRGIHVTPAHCVDAFRTTPIESNDAVTKCNMLHFWCDICDRFVSPIMYVKLYTHS